MNHVNWENIQEPHILVECIGANTLFSLVHYYVRGLCQVLTTLGFIYFVLFSEYFSRCTRVFLMKNCFELFDVFEKFYNEILNQYGVSLKTLVTTMRESTFLTPSLHSFLHMKYMYYTSSTKPSS